MTFALIIGFAEWLLLLFAISQLVSIARSTKRTADAVEELAMRARGSGPKPQMSGLQSEIQAEWERALAKARR